MSIPERAAAETPFGGTIAHGFLLLSLLSAMTFETLPPLEGSGMGINHGFDKMRFHGAGQDRARASAPASSSPTSMRAPPAGCRSPTT